MGGISRIGFVTENSHWRINIYTFRPRVAWQNCLNL